MFEVLEDYVKQRLTDPEVMARAVEGMRAQGFDETDILVELLKLFYLDLDEYAQVVRAA